MLKATAFSVLCTFAFTGGATAQSTPTKEDILASYRAFFQADELLGRCKYSFSSEKDLRIVKDIKDYFRGGLVSYYKIPELDLKRQDTLLAAGSQKEGCRGQNEINMLKLVETLRRAYKAIYDSKSSN